MTRNETRELADKVIAQLKPYVLRGNIAGSYRRGKPESSDLDLVCIPKREDITDMFGTIIGTKPVQGFCDVINSWEKIKGDPTGKYCQRIVDGHKVEIAIAVPENWGNLLIIRTGDKDFSHKLMIIARQRGLEQRDGFLYRENKLIPCYEEKDYFAALGLNFIEPQYRDENAFRITK